MSNNNNDDLDQTMPDKNRENRNSNRDDDFSFDDSSVGAQIGRYTRLDRIGQGSFGVVYRAKDEALGRLVAVKVLTRFSSSVQADAWIEEARVLAGLDHPAIVPVYDVGKSDKGQPFIVSKLIDGGNLARRSGQQDWTMDDSIRIVTQLAGALDYLHRKGVMHRDIKPSNILTTSTRDAVLVDFGLALPESAVGKGSRFVGTPAYMSPEQARYEGHRVDGRSDIYSLGVVFYELLTGTRPFTAKDQEELLECIRSLEVRPLRQINSLVPKELERICLKALSKRASDRYSTAADLVEDLTHWHTAHAGSTEAMSISRPAVDAAPTAGSSTVIAEESTKSIDIETVGVIPHGLRPFEKADADFFKHLIPGARDRNGIPDSVNFWATRIESRSTESAFRVGVLMGPSGSGKSSFLRAGVLPQVSGVVNSIYLEARPTELEADLLKAIRQKYPQFASEPDLRETLIRIRSNASPQRPKLLIVIDQFEQWLNHHRDVDSSPLHEALRQCDGINIQSVLLVRDDFLLGLSNFMEQLDESLLQNQNFATIEPFGPNHGRKVLAAFGRAFSVVNQPATPQQEQFIHEAIANLAETGRLQPVHIALFSEMVKNRPWVPSTLRELGGIQGLEVSFLEERLSGSSAHPLLRAHVQVVERILKELLPADGTVIKPPACAQSLLLERLRGVASEDLLSKLLQLIDTEVRLITPTSSNSGSVIGSASQSSTADPAYQLTHDHLVITIRRWLESRSMSSRAGRAAEQLREISAMWNAKPSPKRLPTILEWATIRWLVPSNAWTVAEARLMGAARNRFGVIAAVITLIVVSIYGGVSFWTNGRHAKQLAVRLLEAKNEELVPLLKDIKPYAAEVLALAELRSNEVDEKADVQGTKLRLGLVGLETDYQPVEAVLDQIAICDDRTQIDLVRFLTQHPAIETSVLVKQAEISLQQVPPKSLAPIALLSQRSANDPVWEGLIPRLANYLLHHSVSEMNGWTKLLQPVSKPLVKELLSQVESDYQKGVSEESDEPEPETARQILQSQRNLTQLVSILARDDADSLARAAVWAPADLLPTLIAASQAPRELSVELRSLISKSSYYERPTPIEGRPDLVELQKKYSGKLFETGGWFERVPLDQAEACVVAMKDHGLVPCSFRPYSIKSSWYAAITWKSGDGPIELKLDLSDSKLQEEFDSKQTKGYALVDFCRYGDKQNWSAIWQHDPEQASRQILKINQKVEDRQVEEKGVVMLRYQQRANREDEPTYDILWGAPEELSGVPQSEVRNIYWSRIEFSAGDHFPGYYQADLRSDSTYSELDRSTAWGDLMEIAARNLKAPTRNISLANQLCRLGNFEDAHELLLEVDEGQLKKSEVERRNFFRLKGRIFWNLGMVAELEELIEQTASVLDRDLQFMKIAVAVLKQDLPAVSALLQSTDASTLNTSVERLNYLRVLGFVAAQSEMPEQSSLALKLFFQSAENWFRESNFQRDVLLDAEFDPLRGRADWDKFMQKSELTRRFSSCHYIPSGMESKQVLTLSIAAHSQRVNELLADGYLPTVWIVDSETQDVSSVWSRRNRSVYEDSSSAERIAALIFALAKLGEIDVFLDGLNGKWGKTVQTSLIANAKDILTATTVVGLLKAATSVPLQTALLSALAAFKPSDFEESDLKYLRLRLSEWMADAKDIALLNMSRFCAVKLGEQVSELPRHLDYNDSRNWYTNSIGQQFAVIAPPPECQVGPKADVRRLTVRIGRVYGISSTEVTGDQFQEFFSDPRYQAWVAANPRLRGTAVLVPGSLPQSHVSWFVAVQFCQWLNEKEQVPEDQWCYKNVWGEEGEYPIPYPNYLSRTGYRLPTLAEWCWAAGGGSTVDRWHFGNSSKWSDLFGWTSENSNRRTHTVATLRPNEFGLFDTCGNVIEWTDNFDRRPSRIQTESAVPDSGNSQANDGGSSAGSVYLIEMGGHFKATAISSPLDRVSMNPAIYASPSTGFRLARTLKIQRQ